MASPSKPPPESSNQAKVLPETLMDLPLLELRLNKPTPYQYQARNVQPQKPNPFCPPAPVDNSQEELESIEKLKAARIPATLITIGSWQFASVHEADLVVKFYFATRKLVWEVLANGTKKKMEIQWSDISAIRATIEENKPEILELELHQPPTFYKEIDPQPGHHPIWISADDFTGGQALSCRRHHVEFPSAALNKSYVKLLNSDGRLLELSQSGFPSSVEDIFCTLQHFNCIEYPPRLAIAMPQAHQVLQSAYPPLLTPQRRQSYEAAIQQAFLCRDSTPPMSELDSPLLENHKLENSHMTPWDQLPNNVSQFEALPPLHPADAANPALYHREDLYSPYVGEAGVLPLQVPAIMKNTQGRLFSNPISSYNPSLLPAIQGTSTSHISSPSAINSARNDDASDVKQEHSGYANSSGEFIIGPPEQKGTFTSPIGMLTELGSARNCFAMGVEQEHDGYANSSGQFIIDPLEQSGAFTSPTGTPRAIGSAINSVAMGVRQERDGFASSSGQFIICPSEQNDTFTSPMGSPSALGFASNGIAMDGSANSNRQLIFGPSEQNGTFTSPIGSYAVGFASHGNAMAVGQEHNGFDSSDGQFDFGPSEPEGQIYEQLTPLMRHQDYEENCMVDHLEKDENLG